MALNPLLLVIIMSAWWSSSRESISSRFLEMASWSGVSPSESYNNNENLTKRTERITFQGNFFHHSYTQEEKYTLQFTYLQTRPDIEVEKHFDNSNVSFIDGNVECRLASFVSGIEVGSVPGKQFYDVRFISEGCVVNGPVPIFVFDLQLARGSKQNAYNLRKCTKRLK